MAARIRNYGSPDEESPPGSKGRSRSRRSDGGTSSDKDSDCPPSSSDTGGGERVSVVVSIKDDDMDQIQEIADRLRDRGMEIPEDWVGSKLPIISGTVDPEAIDSLCKEKGVESVRRARIFGMA